MSELDGRESANEARRTRLSAAKRLLLEQRARGQAPLRGALDCIPARPPGDAPLSFAQERMWFLQQLYPAGAAFHVRVVQRLRGPLDVNLLEECLQTIIGRHEALRTTFPAHDGVPAQVVSPSATCSVTLVDLRHLGDVERQAAIAATIDGETSRPFDLASGPLLRVSVMRLRSEDHVLLLVTHHIVVDGQSVGTLFRELGELYGARKAGLRPRLPDLPIQYADFAAWQRSSLTAERLERHLAYWKEQLAGAPPVLELPTDRPRPAVPTHRGAHRRVRIAAPLTRALKAVSRRAGATMYMTLLATFEILLARYTGQTDVVVGSPVAGRLRAELEPLIGCFINMVTLRANVADDPTFEAFLARVRQTVLDAQEHQELPFEQLVAELQPERAVHTTPLFQVLFGFQNVEEGGLRLAGTTAETIDHPVTTTAKHDLSVSLTERGGEVTGAVEYATDSFDPTTIDRFIGHYMTLLEEIVARPGSRLSQLRLLSPAEHRTMAEWQVSSPVSIPTVPEVFAAHAAATPAAVAVVEGARTLSYGDLERRANRVAHALRQRGIRRGTLVGVSLPRSIDLVVAQLAVLKVGAAYVPLDPGYPAERLGIMVGDTETPLVISDPASPNRLPSGIAVVDAAALESEAPPIDATPPCPAAADDLAYVMFTSGSTGRPKGVMVTHRGILRLAGASGLIALGPDDTLAHVSNPSFDAATFEIWGALLNGGRLVVMPHDLVLTVDAFVAALRDSGVTTLTLTTPLFNEVVAHVPDVIGRMRHVLFGADRVDPASVATAIVHGAPERLLHVYGPTENMTFTTGFHVRQAPKRGETVPIGRPVTDTCTYVLDRFRQPVPPGVIGELVVGGAGLSPGYWKRPALTAEKFVPDPLSAIPGSRVYRTGDLGRWRVDGELEFVGRRDHQVKIRGFRVEPGEIEAVLRGHPSVGACAVVAREEPKGRRLVGYVVGTAGAGFDLESDLRSFLSARLPDYMVPSALVRLERLPLTPNGKVDRGALPGPDAERPVTAAPRTPTEEVIAGIWAEVLGLDDVSVHDDFFDLGGHSLLAMRVVARMRRAFGIDLAVRALFEKPTVAALAAEIARTAARGRHADVPPPAAGAARPDRLPLSFAQQRMWYMQQLAPASTALHIPLTWRGRGHLDIEALSWALTELLDRHETLRTRFPLRDGVPLQIIDPPAPVTIDVEDHRTLTVEAQEFIVRARTRAVIEQPFDLATGPLWRARVMKLGADHHVLALVLHHIVADAWSLDIFCRELAALYSARLSARSSPLAPLSLQYADFSTWQHTWLEGDRLDRELAFWKANLAGAPALLQLPSDRPRPPIASGRGGNAPVRIGPALTKALRALSRQHDVTLYMVLLAAFQVLVTRYTGQKDLVIGTSIAGRTQAEAESLIGVFFNVLPLRTSLAGNPSFVELLGRVRETTLGAYQHQDLPFERLVRELSLPRTLSYSPVFQVLFELHDSQLSAPALPGLVIDSVWIEGSHTAKYDLTMSLVQQGDGVAGGVEYSRDLFEPATVERLVGHYLTLLESIVQEPGQAIAQLPLIPAAERRQLVNEWNATALSWDPACLDELFEAQAHATPTAVAVEAADGASWTYAALNARANQLARILRRGGVGPDDRVAICVPRSIDLIAGLLGVLKAGAAYVPLDPSYPAERLQYMASDAGVRSIVTHASCAAMFAANAPVLCLDRMTEALAAEDSADLPRVTTPAHLAYVYYTSGSTGRPKGVAINHDGIVNYVRWGCRAYGAAMGGGAPLHSSIAVDLTLTNLLPLFAGGRVQLVEEGPGVDGLVKALHARPRWGLLKLTPTHLALLNPALTPEEREASARVLVIGADQLTAEPTAVWQETAPGVTLINEYGPTETVVGCSSYVFDRRAPKAGVVPIGRPIANTTFYVMDPERELLPIGIPGELYIGGVGVARGYWGRPGLTAAQFVPDPFRGIPGGRMYKTGDRARYLPSGDLECLGRFDDQVKLRGYRVELAEIEAVLTAHPAIHKAVALLREDAPGDRRLVAYVATGATDVHVSELRDHMKRHLPDYMLPTAVVCLPELPMGANGKIDRRALPPPDRDRPHPGAAYVAPANAVEEELVHLWEALLDVRPIGMNDNFYDLGGHSLLATRLLAQIRLHFQVELPLSLFVTGATVREMSAVVRTQNAASSIVVPIQPEGTRPPLFCVHPAGGQVLCYTNLARHLDRSQPLYGLQDPYANAPGGYSPHSIAQTAGAYVAAIRRVRPHGPYCLLGWSFGGTVAFEMAQQLRRAGEDVPLLVQLDTPAPRFARRLTRTERDDCVILAGLARERAYVDDLEVAISSDDLLQLARQRRCCHVVERLNAAGVTHPGVTAESFEQQLERWWGRIHSLQTYEPHVYSGRMLLIRAASTDTALHHDWAELMTSTYRDRALGWSEFVSTPIDILDVPGHHNTIGREPYVRELAAQLAARLAAAVARMSPAPASV
ncbi:MAG: amino acid adenylation domain-containing protein [Vicinamibacterales bacterium]